MPDNLAPAVERLADIPTSPGSLGSHLADLLVFSSTRGASLLLKRCLLPLASVFLLASCGDDDPSGPGNLSGSMSFTYTGAGGGTFNASGTAPALAANIGNSSFSAGFRDDAETQLGVFGVRARGGGRYDMMVLGISRLTVGSVNVEADCDPDLGEACSGFVFITNVSESDDSFDFWCIPTSGTLSISSISSTRAEGTFTGSGQCFNEALQFSNFTIVNGTYSVALLSESQLPQ